MKKFFVLSIVLLWCDISWAQKNRIDSLLAKMDQAESIKSLAPVMDELLATPRGDFALLKKGKQDFADAQASGNLKKQQRALAEISKAAFSLHDTPELLDASLQGIEVSRKLADNKLLGDFLHRAGLANVYQHETRKGISYTLMAANAHKAAGDIHAELNDYSNIESSYIDLKMPDSALAIANLELSILKKINKNQPDYWKEYRLATGDLGEALASGGRPDSALNYYIKAYQAIKRSKEITTDLPYLINNLAKTYFILGKRDSAAKYAFESYGLASNTRLWEFTADAASILAKVYEGHDDKKSTYYLKIQLAANDSINASDRAKQFQLITEKERQRKDDLKAEKERFNTRLRLYVVIGVAIILLIIGLILWRNNKKQKYTNLLLSEQKEEISAQRDNLERQNRELEIEAALERVRVRTMAMQKSEELVDVSGLLHMQIKGLGIKIRTIGFNVWSEDSNSFTDYGADPLSGFIKPYSVNVTDSALFREASDARKRGDAFFVQYAEGERLKEAFEALQKCSDDEQYRKTLEDQIQFTKSQVGHFVFVSNVSLLFISGEPVPEAHDIFKRFGKVFEQTYTRFLDLQKAEAQAREAQIEVALERTRTQSMIMQHSNELDDTLRVFHEQVLHLGINSAFSFLWLPDEEKDRHIFWAAWAEDDSKVFKSKAIDYQLDRNEPATAQCLIDWKGQDPVVSYHVPPEGVESYFAAWQELIDGVESLRPDYFSAGLHYVEAFMKYGCFGVMVENPLSEEEKKILGRFSIEFERTYTRFLDLQKAEVQAREAQIEAALERVRSKTMAMHSSPDIADTSVTMFHELVKLGVESTIRCGVAIISSVNDLEVWTASLKEDGSITLNIGNLTMSAHPLLQHVFSAWKNNEAGTRYNLTGDAVRSYFQVLNDAPGYPFQYPMDSLPEKWGINAFFFKEGCLFAFTGEPLSLEMSQLFKRFAGVFGQTYTRFLDLQKAEAQAREAQIEAALERVRSKTMAMHSSHDIADTVAAMFDELIKIGIKNDVRSGISILSNPQEMEIWTGYSKPDGKVGLNIGSLEIASHPMLQRAYDLWVKKESHSTYTLTGEDQKNYYKAINNSKHYHAKFDIGSLPQKTIQNAFYFPEGFIHIFSHEQITDQEEQIFKRFAGVFGLTYRRFLDLEKAEAQAKEARIQTALERVRAAAMAMRTPGELLDICRILSNELNSLGFDGIRNAQIVVFDDKQGSFLDYEYYDEERNGISEVHYRGHPIIEEFVEVIRASGDVFMGNELTGEKLSDWKSYRNQSGQMPDKQLEKASALYYYWYSTELGALGLSAFKSILDDDLKILKRFRNVFDLAYSRYADITKAEAQAREAQIEAALERVRSRTLAMQKSDELAETAAVLFRQMISLGIEPNRLYIGITKEDTAEIEFWITDEDGSKVSNMFTGDANKNLSMKKMHDAWRANQKSIVIDMRGDELTEYLHYLGEILHVPFKGGLEQKRRVTYISFFSNGFIGMASPADQPQETIDLLDRFAYVFNLTYARFNDLKIAELHAIQAEQDLIAIKAARKNAEDALTDLRAAQKQLIQSEKMASLGELTAGIAHEIQNPLNFVNNFSEVSAELIEEMTEELDKGDIEEVKAIAGDIKDNLEKIRHHGKRADGIVKGMLQHSRTSSGQKEPTDLNALADEYLRLSYHGLRAKDKSFNAELVTNFDKGLPKISVIPQDMGRVILNLINNAFYATQQKQKMAGPDYKPTVEVKTKVSGDQALISVKDNGIGIPENIKDKILQPFFTTKPTGEGTGLGLSLSYDIVVKSHEGNILINSAEGNGSEFIINLPLKP